MIEKLCNKMVVTLAEAMEHLPLCDKTIRKLIKDGHLQRAPGVRRVLITVESLKRYLDAAPEGRA